MMLPQRVNRLARLCPPSVDTPVVRSGENKFRVWREACLQRLLLPLRRDGVPRIGLDDIALEGIYERVHA